MSPSYLERNLNASKPSEYRPNHGKKMSKRLNFPNLTFIHYDAYGSTAECSVL